MAAAATPARSQPPAERRTLEQFRDSLAALSDSAPAIRQIEARLMRDARRDRANPMLHLRLGLVARSLGAWSDAAAEFKWAAELEPRWPAAWFGWALAEIELGDEVGTARTTRRLVLAQHAWRRAVEAMARAVELDPSLAAAGEAEARRNLDQGRADRARVIRDALRAVAGGPRQAPAVVFLALGRVERALGDLTAAVEAFDRAAALPGGRGPALLERARTQLAAGDPRGIQAYFDGAAVDDPVAAAGYRDDLSLVAGPDELAAFDRLTGDERARFLWEFWAARDRNELRRNGERLGEHYRRVEAARAAYGGLDDLRAQVLIRHGEPTSRASLRHPALPANESWFYPRPDGDLVMHFVARADSTDFQLAESLFAIAGVDPDARGAAGDEGGQGGQSGQGGRRGGEGVGAEQLLRSRAQLGPLYQAAAASRGDQTGFRAWEREVSRRGRRLALTTDRYPVRFERELPARIQLAALSGDTLGPALHVLFSVPAFAFANEPGGAAGSPVRVRAVVRDSAGRTVRAADTTLVAAGSAGDPVAGAVAVPLSPGRYSVRVAVQVGEAGAIASRDSLRLVPAGTDALALSDLLLAGPRAPISWAPAGQPATGADPAPALRRSDSLTIYVEPIGARGGTGRARLLLRRVRAGADSEGRWRAFPGRSDWMPVRLEPAEAVPGLRISAPLGRLGRGLYEVQVVLVDGSGATAWQRGRFAVED